MKMNGKEKGNRIMEMNELKELAIKESDRFMEIWNEFCLYNRCDDERIYYMADLDEDAQYASPTELAFAFFNGYSVYPGTDRREEFNPNHNYYYRNGYDNFVSFEVIYSECADAFIDCIDEDKLLDYINEEGE